MFKLFSEPNILSTARQNHPSSFWTFLEYENCDQKIVIFRKKSKIFTFIMFFNEIIAKHFSIFIEITLKLKSLINLFIW